MTPMIAICLWQARALQRSILRSASTLLALGLGWLVVSPLNLPQAALVGQPDWWWAGQGFQVAAIVGSVAACAWGAYAIQDERENHVLELGVVAPISAADHVLGRYLGVVAAVGFPGLVLSLVLPLQRLMFGAHPGLTPYLSGLGCIYMPVVMFSAAFGMTVATLVRSARGAVVSFSVWWLACVLRLPVPALFRAFDVGGSLQYAAFFESAGGSLESAPLAVRATVIAALPLLRVQAYIAMIAMIALTAAMLILLTLWVHRLLKRDAHAFLD